MLSAQLLPRTAIDEAAWDAFIEASPQCYLYFRSWFLDAACPGWSAITVEQKGRWVAVLPLPLREKWGIRYSFQPHLTQFLGIAYAPFEGERRSHYHFLKTTAEAILTAVPNDLLSVDFKLHPSVQFFLPFYWEGWETLPRLTYWLPIEGSYESAAKSFSSSVGNHLKKAKKAGVFLVETTDEAILPALALREKVFNPGQAAAFSGIWKAVRERGQGFMLKACDPEGRLHACAAYIWDDDRMIFLANAQDRSLRQHGGNALLVAEGIRRCFQREGTRWFDFEGSMLEPVEQYFRSFNPEAKAYFSVRRERFSWLFRVYRGIKG